jgi:hypothetical protein
MAIPFSGQKIKSMTRSPTIYACFLQGIHPEQTDIKRKPHKYILGFY